MVRRLILVALFGFLAAVPAPSNISAQAGSGTPQTSPAASRIALGPWIGAVEADGAKLRLVVRFATTPDGRLTAQLDSPDQMVAGLPIEEVTVAGGSVVLKLGLIQATYEGRLSADGASLSGVWRQGGQTFPVTFTRPSTTPAVARPKRPQDPEGPVPYREEDVTYPSGSGLRLAGTLTIPASGGPFPAVLLVSGTGPQDRNGSVFGHRPFLVLADYLTLRGIAVLRVDDRGVGRSGGDLTTSTLADLAEDIRAGIRLLAGRTDIRPDQVGLIGHSEGAVVASLVAAGARPSVAFLVTLAGPGIGGVATAHAQWDRVVREAGEDPQATAPLRLVIDGLIEAVRTGLEGESFEARVQQLRAQALIGMSPEKRHLLEYRIDSFVEFARLPSFRSFIRHDHELVLRSVTCPILAIFGERDVQVPPADHVRPLVATLEGAGHRDYSVVKLPALNHFLQTSVSGGFEEYHAIDETIAPIVLATIANWVQARSQGSGR